jgi:aromatic-L-amino-acid decarboxylase
MREASLDIDDRVIRDFGESFNSLVAEYFQQMRDLPVFPQADALELSKLSAELPLEGAELQSIVEDCRALITGSRHNGHPRFFGYVASPSTIPGVFGDFFAAAINQNVTSWRSAPAATHIEKTVISWLSELTGFGPGAPGILTSGGSMANLNALTMAHRSKCGFDASQNGVADAPFRMTLYASDQVHHSILKAADLIGLGRKAVRIVETDDRLRMDVLSLRERIESDLRAGIQPFCVVATAGTVNTGAVDPLVEIAKVAKEFGLWFHVDSAYGAPAAMVNRKRRLFDGLEFADSMSIDPHKWLYTPVDCGCLLFRNAAMARNAFGESSEAEYIKVYEEAGDESFAFWDYGIELSRRFRALKLWMTFKYYGVNKLAAVISEDNELAAYMGEQVERRADFELLAPVELSICCFRYVPADLRLELERGGNSEAIEQRLNDLNSAIMHSIQRGGRAYLSNAMLRGRYALRACIVNFRTTREDIDLTLDLVRQTAVRLGYHV